MQKQSKTLELTNEVILTNLNCTEIKQLNDSRTNIVFRYDKSRSKGTFSLVKWIEGRNRWVKLGRYPDISTTIARKAALIAEEQLTLSSLQGKIADVTPSSIKKIADVLHWYLVRVQQDKSMAVHSRKGVYSVINAHLLPRVGYIKVKELTRSKLDEQLMWPLQQTLKPSTLRQVFQILKRAVKRADGAGIIINDPMALFAFKEFVIRKINVKPARLTAVDLPRIFDDIQKAPANVQIMMLTMLMFGTRVGETSLARWNDFDQRAHFWRIPADHTKTKQPHRLPMTDLAQQVLNCHRQQLKGPTKRSQYLFAKRHDPKVPITPQYASQQVSKYARGGWSAHDLRKLARTLWLELGIDYVIGEFLLNHQLRAVDQAYIQTFADKKCMEALICWHRYLFEHGLSEFLSLRPSKDRTVPHTM